jgi:peptide chain release factor subunit 1
MITESELQGLIDFQSDDTPVLSVFLNVDPSQHSKEKYKLALRKLLKEVTGRAAPEDIERVERYFNLEYNWQGKGVALFSCAAGGLWRAYSLAVPVEDGAFTHPRPYVKPLTDLMGQHAPYGVILIGKEGARLFSISMGEVEDSADLLGEETKRHKQGGWAASRYQRRDDEQAQHNLKASAELAADFFQPAYHQRLLIGGTEETVAQFKTFLPKALRDLIVATIPIDITAPDSEVLARSMDIVRGVERVEEKRLVEQAITLAAKGEAGAIGLDDTLAAVQEERVHILLVDRDFHVPGYRCEGCGYVTTAPLEKCAYCGGVFIPVEHVAEFVVRRVVGSGGRVEIVHDAPKLKEAGGIAAILRY